MKRRRQTIRRPARRPWKLPAPLAALHRRVFQHRVDPFILGVYRAALGLFLLLYFAMIAPHWATYYGPGGISLYAGTGTTGYWFPDPILMHVTSSWVLWLIYGVSVVAAGALAAGALVRPAVIWLWVVNHSLIYANPYAANGEEQVLAVLLLFSIFLPLGRSFTLRQLADAERRREMLSADEKVEVWALVPLQAHLALIYLYGLPLKLLDAGWQSGLVVYYAMMEMDYPRFPGLSVFAWKDGIVSRALTYGTLAAELLIPILIWFRRLRAPCALAAILLHLGLGVLLEGVVMFNGAMIVAWLLFLPSRRTREWLAAVARRPRRRPPR